MLHSGSSANTTTISASCPFQCTHGSRTSRNFILDPVNDKQGAVSSHRQSQHIYIVSKRCSPNIRQIILDNKSYKKIERLATGVGTQMQNGTNAIKFILNTMVPKDRNVTYGKIICDILVQKKDTHRCRLTVGGGGLSRRCKYIY